MELNPYSFLYYINKVETLIKRIKKENSMNLLEAKKVMRDAGYKLMKEELMWTYTPEIEDKLVATGAAKYAEEDEDDGEEASWDDDGFATDFRKSAKFVRAAVKEDLVYDCLKACKRCMSAEDVRRLLIKAAEKYALSRKHPDVDDFAFGIKDYFKHYKAV